MSHHEANTEAARSRYPEAGDLPGRRPVAVHVFWHPDDLPKQEDGDSLIRAEPWLVLRTLMGDPFDAAGEAVGIPVVFHSCLPGAGSDPPPPPDLDASDRSLVVALVGANVLRRTEWRSWVASVRREVADRPGRCALLGVALVPEALDQEKMWANTNVHRADDEPDLRPGRVLLAVLSALARLLAVEPGRRVRVFYSYARADGGPFVAELQDRSRLARLDDFIDAQDIQEGDDFAEVLGSSVAHTDTAVLAVVTDAYSKRDWCRREVLIARENEVPLAILDAVSLGQARLAPYFGHMPSVRLPIDVPGSLRRFTRLDAALVALLLEVVRFRFLPLRFERMAKQLGRASSWSTLPTPPEPLTLLGPRLRAGIGTFVYPDPPLNPDELSRLQRAPSKAGGPDGPTGGIRFLTATQAFAESRAAASAGRPDRPLLVGVSISDIPEESLLPLGLSAAHVDLLFAEVCRHILVAGHRIAYGGDLRLRGFTEQLLGLSRVVRRYQTTVSGQDDPMVVSYLTQFNLDGPDGARIGSFVNDCDIVELPVPEWVPAGGAGPIRAAMEFTAMRERMTADIDVRLVVGGKVFGALGRGPGVLEEAALACEAGVPLLVAGGFGGAGGLTARALTGRLTGDEREAVCNSYQEINASLVRTARPRSCAELLDALTGKGSQLNNGLEPAENERLLNSADIDEIVSLVLLALTRLGRPRG
ncbi:MAG: TIR domain-containing protein [Acidimicrobiia bacterium]